MSEDYEKKIRLAITTLVTPILIGIVIFFLVRVMDNMDRMNVNVSETLIEMRAIQENIQDHERRINTLEDWRNYKYDHSKKQHQ